MPRQRVRKTNRGTIDTAVYRKAENEHFKDSTKIRILAKKYNVCHVTLYRFIQKLKAGNTNAKVGYRCVNRVFTSEEETILHDYIIQCSKVYFGLVSTEVRKLAYEKKYLEKWDEDHMVGKEWYSGFLKRHPNLSLRSPQATSVSCASSFNEHNVNKSFDNLSEVIDRPNKIVAQKGIKQVGAVTSAERRRLVAVARYQDHMIREGPIGSVGAGNASG
ncbi:hypothetical protein ILUMI_14558 [Ignelater luminosus]|uniref:HTH CENPB-type domain-containing protein n=1 Tax=Ignelater luminosus TaxID=2038154 RepID=A0A8K0G4Q7_IGNLU|nr:hypothetical protein ILUMI_14558 [Ignelater luminosus]